MCNLNGALKYHVVRWNFAASFEHYRKGNWIQSGTPAHQMLDAGVDHKTNSAASANKCGLDTSLVAVNEHPSKLRLLPAVQSLCSVKSFARFILKMIKIKFNGKCVEV